MAVSPPNESTNAVVEDAAIRPFQIEVLIYWNEVEEGGHFAAWEQPQLFSEEVRTAFRSLR